MAKWRDKGYVPDSDEDEEPNDLDCHSEVNDEPPGSDSLYQDIDDVLSEAPPYPDLERSKTLQAAVCEVEKIALGPKDLHRNPSVREQDIEEVLLVGISQNSDDDNALFSSDCTRSRVHHAQAASQPRAEILYQENPGLGDETSSVQVHEPASSPLTSLSSSSPPRSLSNSSPISPEKDYSLVKNGRNVQRSELLGVVITNSRSSIELGKDGAGGVSNAAGKVRFFRQRKAIQLHPYALEGERYRQTLQARGLKPLRIVQAEAEEDAAAAASSREHDSDHEEASSSESQLPNPVQTTQPPSSEIAERVPSPPEDGFAADLLYQGDDEDFPDVDALLRHQPSGALQRGYKRQKMAHTYAHKSQRANQYNAEVANHQKSRGASSQLGSPHGLKEYGRNIFEIPPSPPLSGNSFVSDPRRRASLEYQPLRGITPTKPETPILTSDPPHLEKSPREQIFSDSESDHGRAVEQTVLSEDNSSSPSTEADLENFSQIRKVQRKIRGVLPASWLRLDQQAIHKAPGRRIEPSSTTPLKKAERGRGVARKLVRHQSKDHEIQRSHGRPVTDVETTDSCESSVDDLAASHRAESLLGHVRPPGASDHSIHESNDIWEDDHIDAMLSKKPRRKLDRFLGEGMEYSTERRQHNAHHRSYSWRDHQPKITDHLRSAEIHNSAQSKPTKLFKQRANILDNLESFETPQTNLPLFVKIAARQVRRRRDKGRHSPGRKFIRLHHQRDTADAQSILSRWRRGSIAPVSDDHYQSTAGPAQRSPLTDLLWNDQQNFTLHTPHLRRASLPKHTKADSHHKRIHKSVKRKPRLRQSTLERITQLLPVHTHAHREGEPSIHATDITSGHSQKIIRVRQYPALRQAQVESLEDNARLKYATDTFQRGLSRLDILFREKARRTSLIANIPMARFLTSRNNAAVPQGIPFDTLKVRAKEFQQTSVKKDGRGNRKRSPRRLDPEILDYRQPANLSLTDAMEDLPHTDGVKESTILHGLGRYGTRYEVDFDIKPLQRGTYFHESTFVGSGDFAKSIFSPSNEKPNSVTGYGTVIFQGKALRWGLWTDTVSSELGIVLDWISQAREEVVDYSEAHATSQITSIFRSVIRYFASHIHFGDEMNRTSCLVRCAQLLEGLIKQLDRPCVSVDSAGNQIQCSLTLSRAMFCSVWANQLRQMAKGNVVSKSEEAKLRTILEDCLNKVFSLLLPQSMKYFRDFLEENKYHAKREAGIRDSDLALECIVVAMQIMQRADISNTNLFSVMARRTESIDKLTDARELEKLWRDTMTLLPLQEFDAFGIFAPRSHFQKPLEDWSVIQAIVRRVLTIYTMNSKSQPPTFNEYCRAMFSRCHHLIQFWGWRKCESIIKVIFDFFVGNNLAHLRNEESRGSPRFLEDLDRIDSLQVLPEDRCFHIFLKMIGTALQAMRHDYTDQRMCEFTLRMMPNHGRSYRKEESVRREDLEALRNHHDLLCTLYWASPPISRPPVYVLQRLVDAQTAHREACHINIRAWYNLVKFQLSTEEPASSLEPLAQWHSELTREVLSQHILARTEAQCQFEASVNEGGKTLSRNMLEATISANQRQVEAIISDLLISMVKALAASKSPANATVLLGKPSTAEMLNLFNVHESRTDVVIQQALDVIISFAKLCSSDQCFNNPQESSEDSQDYGSWPSELDLDVDGLTREQGKETSCSTTTATVTDSLGSSTDKAVKHLYSTTFDALAQLVSNAFGSDKSPSESILLLITDAWSEVAHLLVKHKIKDWGDYLGSYSRESWAALRNTQQTRRYKARFLSKILDMDPDSFKEHSETFVLSWIMNLVDPDYPQPSIDELTNNLLNIHLLKSGGPNPLFSSLPFVVVLDRSGRYKTTKANLKERRLDLISSVLLNMRASVQQPGLNTNKLRQDYNQLLQQVMRNMKANIQMMGARAYGGDEYVQFVQSVVELLQEHTSDICPVDHFFTNSFEFPLPTDDPDYIVGRLRNYGRRIIEAGSTVRFRPATQTADIKQLASFIQSLSENAVWYGGQKKLAQQLEKAISDSYEKLTSHTPTLRYVCATVIFPAYYEISLAVVEQDNHLALHPGHVLATPIFQVTQGMVKDMMYGLNAIDPACISAAKRIIESIFSAIYHASDQMINTQHEGVKLVMNSPQVIRVFKEIYATITSILPMLDYVKGNGGDIQQALAYLNAFWQTGRFIVRQFLGIEDGATDKGWGGLSRYRCDYVDAQAFCRKELRGALMNESMRQSVSRPNRISLQKEVQALEEEIEIFIVEWHYMPNLNSPPLHGMGLTNEALGLANVSL